MTLLSLRFFFSLSPNAPESDPHVRALELAQGQFPTAGATISNTVGLETNNRPELSYVLEVIATDNAVTRVNAYSLAEDLAVVFRQERVLYTRTVLDHVELVAHPSSPKESTV